MRMFETFRPVNDLIKKHVSYYYLDIAEDAGYSNEYICYPHYNHTISLYKSHQAEFEAQHVTVSYQKGGLPLQVFTPLREDLLKITQQGPVYKVGIVFEPLGIHQFFGKSAVASGRNVVEFLNTAALAPLFDQLNPVVITEFLDHHLEMKYVREENLYLEKAISLIHSRFDDISIEVLAEDKLGISRKQLNRLFHQYLGTSAQKYRSIVRFRQLMSYKLNQKQGQSLSSLSHRTHYTDQSHFIKSCKQLTGLSPKQFFNEGKIIGTEDTFWNFSDK
jgi:AraC-like DNA-binding protein